MTVSDRTATVVRAMPLLAAVQHNALESVEAGESIEDRLETQEQVDRRSDAYLWRAFQLADVIEQAPQYAVEYARLIKAAIHEGMTLDAIEDEHRNAAIGSAVSVQDLGRATVARLQGAWPGSGPGKGAA